MNRLPIKVRERLRKFGVRSTWLARLPLLLRAGGVWLWVSWNRINKPPKCVVSPPSLNDSFGAFLGEEGLLLR